LVHTNLVYNSDVENYGDLNVQLISFLMVFIFMSVFIFMLTFLAS